MQSQLLYLWKKKQKKHILLLKWQRVGNYQAGGENNSDAVVDCVRETTTSNLINIGTFSTQLLPSVLLLGDGSLAVFSASPEFSFDLAGSFISCVSSGQLSVPGNTAEETSVSTCHVLPKQS